MWYNTVRQLQTNQRSVTDVLNGVYPKQHLTKLNNNGLETVVVTLVQYTKGILGENSCWSENPKWLKKKANLNKIIHSTILNKSRDNLINLVKAFSEFYLTYCSLSKLWFPHRKIWPNDENLEVIKGRRRRRVKRKRGFGPDRTLDINNILPNRKRKTLGAKNVYELKPKLSECVVKLPKITKPLTSQIIEQPKPKFSECIVKLSKITKPLISATIEQSSKKSFMQYFQLCTSTSTEQKKSQNVPLNPIKLQNCPHIPLSSDIGRLLIKEKDKERYNMTDELKLKRLERLDWYVNKPTQKIHNEEYEVTCTPRAKKHHNHHFNFPKRQFHQERKSLHDADFLLQFCRPLSVVIHNVDLAVLKKKMDRGKLRVIVKRLSLDTINKSTCRNLKVLLHKSVI